MCSVNTGLEQSLYGLVTQQFAAVYGEACLIANNGLSSLALPIHGIELIPDIACLTLFINTIILKRYQTAQNTGILDIHDISLIHLH